MSKLCEISLDLRFAVREAHPDLASYLNWLMGNQRRMLLALVKEVFPITDEEELVAMACRHPGLLETLKAASACRNVQKTLGDVDPVRLKEMDAKIYSEPFACRVLLHFICSPEFASVEDADALVSAYLAKFP